MTTNQNQFSSKISMSMLAASLLCALLLGLGTLVLADTDIVLGRYPHAAPNGLSVQQIQGRLILQKSTFETGDPPSVVAAWYAQRYQLQPDYDLVIQGQCVRLARRNSLLVLRQTVVVSMCVVGSVTHVYFDRAVSLGR